MKILQRARLLLSSLAIPFASDAITPLSSGHTDVGIGYENNAFNLHVHDEVNDVEYPPAEALLVVKYQALQVSPGGQYSFLGPAGTPIWVLPKVQNVDLLYLGIGAEELVPAQWHGNIELSLKAVAGPGYFFVWDTDAFGHPVVKMDSADGIGPADTVSVIPGSHTHLNWGFSEAGSYNLSFEASGLSTSEGAQISGPVVYQFQVVPEPGTLALAILGLGAWVLLLRLRRSPQLARRRL